MAKYQKHNWEELEQEFIHSNDSFAEFAKKKGIIQRTVEQAGNRLQWTKKRENFRQLTSQKMLEKTVDERIKKLEEQAEKDLQAVNLAYDLIKEKLQEGMLEPKDIKQLTGSLKDIQAVARLALGANTENININSDFETWLNDRISS